MKKIIVLLGMPAAARVLMILPVRRGILLLAIPVLLIAGATIARAFSLPNDIDGHVHVPGIVTDAEVCGSYVRGAENSGRQTSPSSYSYTMSSSLGIAGAAAAIDFHWVHDTDSDFIVWDMGTPKAIVDVFPSIDHGPVPEEALEFTIYGTNDLAQPEGSWEVADITTIFDEGWDATWIADNWVSRWQFSTHYQYVGLHWGGPKAMISDGDAEIDAVCAPESITNCGRYADENAMINDGRPGCRATYIYDAGQGNTVSRQDILDNAPYFTSQGFDMNFLWYAQKEVVLIQTGDLTSWSSCAGQYHPGQVCPDSSSQHAISNAFSGDVTLNFWKYGDTFISQACGNFGATQGAGPRPKISGYKFHDLDGDGVWDGGEPGEPNWPITLTDPDGNTYQTQTDLDGKYTFDVTSRPGKYTVSEGSQAGWVSTTPQSVQVVIAEGVGDTEFPNNNFGNQQVRAQLTVVKTVVNDHGGTATAGLWTMNVGGTNVSSASFPGEAAPGTKITLNAGTYDVTESGGPSGYADSYVGCSGAIGIGESKTCTITNDDIQPSLTVIKTVVNDHGGTAVSGNWTMNVSGTNVSSTGFPGSETGVKVTLNAGLYNVSETGGPAGYADSYSSECSGTASVGDVLICTITNDDIAPQLTVIKAVVNDHGGTAIAGDWTMNVAGIDVSSTVFPGAATPGVTITLDAGAYSVDESGGPSGYTKSLSADCSGNIAIGESKTCTITNDDIQPSLTIIKTVVNDHGGTAVSGNWTMNITGIDVSPNNFFGQVTPGVKIGLDAGAYSVAESGGPFGYAASFSVGCSGTIGIGESKTCTITNDDIAPELTIIKHVINDEGGTATASDWTMNVTGAEVSSTGFPGQEAPGVTVTLDAGAYSIDESGGVANYKKTLSADCSGSIGIGESKTCTIANDDNLPVVGKSLILQNVWLTRNGTKIPPPDCLSGLSIGALAEALDHPIASPDPKDPSQVQELAAFEFEMHYDNKKICVDLTEGAAWTAVGATCIIQDSESKPQLEGVARIGCVTTGKGHNINELDPLAMIDIYPQPEIYALAKPNQDNGVVVQISNVNCDLSDEQGHAIPISACHDVAVTFRYLEGDVEPDCVVDAVDAQAIAFRWGVEKGSTIYNEFMNVEPSGAQSDNDIDINDLQFVSGRFGSTCDDPHPAQDAVNPMS